MVEAGNSINEFERMIALVDEGAALAAQEAAARTPEMQSLINEAKQLARELIIRTTDDQELSVEDQAEYVKKVVDSLGKKAKGCLEPQIVLGFEGSERLDYIPRNNVISRTTLDPYRRPLKTTIDDRPSTWVENSFMIPTAIAVSLEKLPPQSPIVQSSSQ